MNNVLPLATRPAYRIAVIAALCAVASGCVIEDDSHYVGGPSVYGASDTVSCYTPVQSAAAGTIDPSMVIDPSTVLGPMGGAGAFIEYAPGGHWRIWTACDTARTQQACGWYVTAQTVDGSAIGNVQGESLEPVDRAYVACGNQAVLDAVTTNDTDGIDFDAAPGVGVQVYVYLEGQLHPEMIMWADGSASGVIRQGAPTDPIDIVPSSP